MLAPLIRNHAFTTFRSFNLRPASLRYRPTVALAALWVAACWLTGAAICHAAGEAERPGVTVSVVASDPQRTVLRYELNAFRRDTLRIADRDFLALSLPGEGGTLIEGYPALPRISRAIRIPALARVKVDTLQIDRYELQDVRIAPSKGDLDRDVDPRAVPYTFASVYDQDAWYPSHVATLRKPFIMREVRGVVVEIHPFQYNPVRKILRVTRAIEIAVSTSGMATVNTLRSSGMQRTNRSFQQLYGTTFLNYDHKHVPPRGFAENGEMLIITYDDFRPAIEPLAAWKRSQGIPTTVVNISTIGNNPTKLKGFIQAFYNRRNLSYVLLVGDALEIYPPSSNSASADPTLALVDGNDHYPDIFVGRMCAQKITQVETQVARTIGYERGHHIGPWFRMAAGVASDLPGGHHGETDSEHMDYIRDDLLAYGFTDVDQIYDPTATLGRLTTAINAGRRLINYCGHGKLTEWTTTGFCNDDVDQLVNRGKLPFVVSVACNNGKFKIGECLAEAWMQATDHGAPTGAVAMYASTILMSWQPPMTAQDEIVDLFVAEALESFGGLCFAGSCRMITDHGTSGEKNFDSWHVFGDPSLRIRPAPRAVGIILPGGIPRRVPPGAPFTVTLEIYDGTEQLVAGSEQIHYRLKPTHSFTTEPLTSLGGGLYEGWIAAPQPGDSVELYFSAAGSGGTTVFEPAGAPAEVFAPRVGIPITVVADNFETDQGWTVKNTQLADGAWVRVDPVGSTWLDLVPQPEDDNPYGTGTHCFVTGQGVPGGAAWDDDVDGGPTRLISPELDMSGGGTLSFYYHFYNDSGDDMLLVELSNDGGATWVPVTAITHDPEWKPFSFDVADYLAPTDTMRLMFSTGDRPDNSVTEAAIDDVKLELFITAPSLWADDYALSAATGGIVTFTLDAGIANQGRDYTLLASANGTYPGYQLPGGGAVLPLNWDWITSHVWSHLSSPAFLDFQGTLDSTGRASSVLNTHGPITIPELIGAKLTFAFAVGQPWDFASTPMPLMIQP